jgi:uncharacterized protein
LSISVRTIWLFWIITGDEWPEETRENFVTYVQNGGGVVVYHAANNAFPDWPEYNEIIGLGGWGERDENAGPYMYIEDGEVVRDNSPEGEDRMGDDMSS